VRSLVIGLVSLVFVALIIGGVFSLFALGAVNVAGLANSGPAPKPSLYMPPLSKHPSPAGNPSPAAPASPIARSAAATAPSRDAGNSRLARATRVM